MSPVSRGRKPKKAPSFTVRCTRREPGFVSICGPWSSSATPSSGWSMPRAGAMLPGEAYGACCTGLAAIGSYALPVSPGSTEHAVLPHRTRYFRELISDWQDDPVTDAAPALLPEWVSLERRAGQRARPPGRPCRLGRVRQPGRASPTPAQGSNGCPNGPHCSRKYSMILLACS